MAPQTRHDSLAWELARWQEWVVTRQQLLDLGLTPDGIRHRVEKGRLSPVYRGVYAVGRPELSLEGKYLAAVLACGEGAALSHLSAGLLWEISDLTPARPQVTVRTGAGRSGKRGIEVIRSVGLLAGEVTVHRAVPVTTLARTLMDMTSRLDVVGMRSAIRQSERVHGLDLARVRADLVAKPPTSPGPARLRRMLDELVPGETLTESRLEAAFLDICAQYGLPLPEKQVKVGRHRADFMWPALRLVVEVDGRGSHDGYVAFLEDRVKDRALKAAGFEVLRFTWSEVINQPAMVAREVRLALDRRARELGVSGLRG